MKWLLLNIIHQPVASGSFWGVLEEGEAQGVVSFQYSQDGTVRFPRLARGYAVLPERALKANRRRVA